MSALHELQQALRNVEDQLEQARQQMHRARERLREAESALTRLDPEHPETVVPPGLRRADDQIERTTSAVEHVTVTLRDFAARL